MCADVDKNGLKLPTGWERRWSEKKNRFYYFSRTEKRSIWNFPDPTNNVNSDVFQVDQLNSCRNRGMFRTKRGKNVASTRLEKLKEKWKKEFDEKKRILEDNFNPSVGMEGVQKEPEKIPSSAIQTIENKGSIMTSRLNEHESQGGNCSTDFFKNEKFPCKSYHGEKFGGSPSKCIQNLWNADYPSESVKQKDLNVSSDASSSLNSQSSCIVSSTSKVELISSSSKDYSFSSDSNIKSKKLATSVCINKNKTDSKRKSAEKKQNVTPKKQKKTETKKNVKGSLGAGNRRLPTKSYEDQSALPDFMKNEVNLQRNLTFRIPKCSSTISKADTVEEKYSSPLDERNLQTSFNKYERKNSANVRLTRTVEEYRNNSSFKSKCESPENPEKRTAEPPISDEVQMFESKYEQKLATDGNLSHEMADLKWKLPIIHSEVLRPNLENSSFPSSSSDSTIGKINVRRINQDRIEMTNESLSGFLSNKPSLKEKIFKLDVSSNPETDDIGETEEDSSFDEEYIGKWDTVKEQFKNNKFIPLKRKNLANARLTKLREEWEKEREKSRLLSSGCEDNNIEVSNTESSSTVSSEPMDWEPCDANENNDECTNSQNEPAELPVYMECDWACQISLNINDVPAKKLIVVVDTNILLSNLSFVKKLEYTNLNEYGQPVIVIPYGVIRELDSFKNRICDKTKQARYAVRYLNSRFKSDKTTVIGQPIDLYLNLDVKETDDSMIKFCSYMKDKGKQVILLTNDINLRNKAFMSQIKAFSEDEFKF